METIPHRLKLLEMLPAALDGDEPMLLTELDGLLAGILVCPDLILPGEWLPMVWGGGNKDAAPVFENTKQVEQLVGLIMERYNAVAVDLQRGPGHYAPLFDVDPRHDEILWELWIDGFDAALQLRPGAWARVRGGDEGAGSALAGLVTLVQIGRGESALPKKQVDDLTAKAPVLIPHYIETSMPGGSASKLPGNSDRGTKLWKSGSQRAVPMWLGK